jgi:PmbA protein
MTDQKISKEAANDIDLLQDLVARAKKAGADAADAVLFEGVSLSHARRLGKTEKLERSEGQDLGLRVLIGKRQAMVSSSDRSPGMLAELVERTLAMARAVPEDPFCGLADGADQTANVGGQGLPEHLDDEEIRGGRLLANRRGYRGSVTEPIDVIVDDRAILAMRRKPNVGREHQHVAT